jgi:hypothetical protein
MTATEPSPIGLPDGITLDLVRWRCARCRKAHSWVPTGTMPDPLASAVASAWRHDADHRRWDSETTPSDTAEETR